MKSVLAALLLLVQLQPVLGTVACFGLSERAALQECRMAEHDQAPISGLTAAGATTHSCELATLCMPAAGRWFCARASAFAEPLAER